MALEVVARRCAGLTLIALNVLFAVAAAATSAAVATLSNFDKLGGPLSAALASAPEYLMGGLVYWLVGVVALAFHWNHVTTWSRVAYWLTVPSLFVTVVSAVKVAFDPVPFARKTWVIGAVAGALAVIWGSRRLATLVLTRPLTRALIDSSLEIPFPTRGLTARLCVQNDRLVLDGLTSAKSMAAGRTAIPLHTLRSVTVGDMTADGLGYVLVHSGRSDADAFEYDVWAGPALWIAGTQRQWLVPVTDEVARVAADAIMARAADPVRRACSTKLNGDAGPDRWRSAENARRNAATFLEVKFGRYRRTNYRPWHIAVVIGFLAMPLIYLAMVLLDTVHPFMKIEKGSGTVVGFAVLAVLFAPLARYPIRALNGFVRGQRFVEAYPEPEPATDVPAKPSVEGWVPRPTVQ